MTDTLKVLAHRFLKARLELLKQMHREDAEKVVLNDGYTVEWDHDIGMGGELYTYRRVGDGKEAEEEVDPGRDQA